MYRILLAIFIKNDCNNDYRIDCAGSAGNLYFRDCPNFAMVDSKFAHRCINEQRQPRYYADYEDKLSAINEQQQLSGSPNWGLQNDRLHFGCREQ